MDARPTSPALEPFVPDGGRVAAPDQSVEPEGYVVLVGEDVRIHFHDWGGPADPPGVVLLPGLAGTAWVWAPVARRLISERRVIAADLRGHGLSDAPFEGYDADGLAGDIAAVIDGAGLAGRTDTVLAGHGFGAIVAAWAAQRLGDRISRVVLVDGGWDSVEATSGLEIDEFLRGLDEPPEVLRSMAAFLGDRRGYDPATWDADQERAARESVVETTAGKVVRAVRPHALEASVQAMFDYDPVTTLAAIPADVVAVAARDETGGLRDAALVAAAEARVAAGRSPIRVTRYPSLGHNLPRYRPAEVAAVLRGDG